MPHLLHPQWSWLYAHWLWIFGALAVGIATGWQSDLLAKARLSPRPAHVAIGAVAIVVLLAIAKVVPARYGYRVEVGVSLAVVYAIGCFIGWALRDLAEFMPAATAGGTAALGTATGSYLFRDALAGMGAEQPYMRAATGRGGTARARVTPSTNVLVQAPAPGGYTFPKTLPFADVPTGRRAEPTTGLRRHWTWPTQEQAGTASDSPAAASDATSDREASPRED